MGDIFGGCLKFLRWTVDAGPEPTYDEKLRVPPGARNTKRLISCSHLSLQLLKVYKPGKCTKYETCAILDMFHILHISLHFFFILTRCQLNINSIGKMHLDSDITVVKNGRSS